MGDIRLLYTAQTAVDGKYLMDQVTNVGIGFSLVTEVVNFAMKKSGKNPNMALVTTGRILSAGLAVGGFIAERYYNSRADKASVVIAERANDPRSGMARSLVSYADYLDVGNPLRGKIQQLWGSK